MWPDERVVRFVTENFVPVQLHVNEHAAQYKQYAHRYGMQWTPTTLFLDSDGEEQHRIEGFLPAEEFLSHLHLGLAHLDFSEERWAEAEKRFRDVVDRFPTSEVAPEAMYWAGVCRYKATGSASPLQETADAFEDRYASSSWAKKASVWKKN